MGGDSEAEHEFALQEGYLQINAHNANDKTKMELGEILLRLQQF